MTSLRMAQIGSAGQLIDVAAGGDVDPTSGRLLSVAQLQQALRLAVAMPVTGPQVSAPAPAPAQSFDRAETPAPRQDGFLGRPVGGGLPSREVPAGSVCVVGVSGGSGETTLAQLLTDVHADLQVPVMATDHYWPVGRPVSCPVVLCARTTMASLEAAQRAAAQWAGGAAPAAAVVGLVLMADAAGREPRPITDFARILAGGMPQLWRIPWVPAWRLGPPDPQFLPRPVAAALPGIEAALARCSPVPRSTR